MSSSDIPTFSALIPGDVTDPLELAGVVGGILGQKAELLALRLLELQLELGDGEELVGWVEAGLVAGGLEGRRLQPLLRRMDAGWNLVGGLRRRLAALEGRERLEDELSNSSSSSSLAKTNLKEQLVEAEALVERCEVRRRECEVQVGRLGGEQLRRLREVLRCREDVLGRVGDLREELHRTQLQARLLSFAK